MKRPRARIGIHNLSAEGCIENVRRLFVQTDNLLTHGMYEGSIFPRTENKLNVRKQVRDTK